MDFVKLIVLAKISRNNETKTYFDLKNVCNEIVLYQHKMVCAVWTYTSYIPTYQLMDAVVYYQIDFYATQYIEMCVYLDNCIILN